MLMLSWGLLQQCLELMLMHIHDCGLSQQCLKHVFTVYQAVLCVHLPAIRPSHGAMASSCHAWSSAQSSNALGFTVPALSAMPASLMPAGLLVGQVWPLPPTSLPLVSQGQGQVNFTASDIIFVCALSSQCQSLDVAQFFSKILLDLNPIPPWFFPNQFWWCPHPRVQALTEYSL